MPSITSIPPFPPGVAEADISVIDAQALAAGDPAASRAVYEAATGYGFFYLANHGVEPGLLFDLANDVFALPLEEKMPFDMGTTGHYFGYKRSGAMIVDEKGTPDHSQFYNVSKDQVLGVGGKQWEGHPQVVLERREDLRRFMEGCHGLARGIVKALGKELGLEEGRLEELHEMHRPSVCQARMTHAPPLEEGIISLGPHTDFGSVTVLFNQVGGLQVLRPGSKEWEYVRPRPECAVINLGDAFVKLCGDKLYSAVHRVVGPPGEQSKCERHSVVYFSRPNSSVPLRSLFAPPPTEDEEVMNADQWVAQRAKGLQKANHTGMDSWKASRGTEHTHYKRETATNGGTNGHAD